MLKNIIDAMPTKLGYLIVFVFATILFVPGLDRVHLFDWDEINFAESAREMLVTGDFSRVRINYDPFWEKPPLFFWFQVLCMKIFGVNDFASRLPNALTGIITLLIFFDIARKKYSKTFGIFWCFTYAGTLLPHLYFKSGIIDPLFNLFIFLGIYHIAQFSSYKNKGDTKARVRYAFFAGIFTGLAVLTKGPVALLVMVLCCLVYMAVHKTIKPFSLRNVAVFAVSCGLVSFVWFGLETFKNGPWFIVTFIEYQIRLFSTQDAGHGGPFIYHWVVLLLGCFPASVFVMKGIARSYDENPTQKMIRFWLTASLFVVLVLFSIVKTKIIHYSSFCYLPISFFATDYLVRWMDRKKTFPNWQKLALAFIGVIWSLAVMVVPFVGMNAKNIPNMVKIDDVFAVANLQAAVDWSGWESLIGFLLLASLIFFFVFMKQRPVLSAVVLFTGTIMFIQLVLYVIVPKIERYSQGANIDFLKSLEDKDCYVFMVDFKSYAHYYYPKIKLHQNPLHNPELMSKADTLLAKCPNIENPQQRYDCVRDWFLDGEIDKPVYFVTKNDRGHWLKERSNLQLIEEKNGFLFYKRDLNNSN